MIQRPKLYHCVYFLSTEEKKVWKIGTSSDLVTRVRQVQLCCNAVISCYRFAKLKKEVAKASGGMWGGPGTYCNALERQLHEHFKEYRLHGEWFDISESQIDEVLESGKFTSDFDVYESDIPGCVKCARDDCRRSQHGTDELCEVHKAPDDKLANAIRRAKERGVW